MVHPRRNDRFLAASGLLRTIYPEVDFAEFHFNRHLLTCSRCRPTRFHAVRAELETAWVARMKMLIDMIEGKVVLLWLSDHAPLAQDSIVPAPDLSQNPLFVSREMLDEIAPRVDRVVEVVVSREAMKARTEGMVYGDMDAPAARKCSGPAPTVKPLLRWALCFTTYWAQKKARLRNGGLQTL